MNDAANDNAGLAAKAVLRRCPICGKPASANVLPFCSKRCADVDLHRWLGEGYRVPLASDDDLQGEAGDD